MNAKDIRAAENWSRATRGLTHRSDSCLAPSVWGENMREDKMLTTLEDVKVVEIER